MVSILPLACSRNTPCSSTPPFPSALTRWFRCEKKESHHWRTKVSGTYGSNLGTKSPEF